MAPRECAGRSECDGSGDDDPPVEPECDKPEKVMHSVFIRSAADFDALPEGCWDLYGKLSIEGSQITSLKKLGQLIGIDELEIASTGLTTLDAAVPLHVY